METPRTVSLLLLIAVTLATTDAAVKPVVMAPVKAAGTPEAALIIVPGASIKGEAYRPLANVIQSRCPLKLWVVLLEGFIMDTPNPLELGPGVTSALSALQQQGMTSHNVFLAGHSLGGVFVGPYAQSHSQTLKGALLFASYLTKNVELSSFPLPVLTIAGDLDGQTRITRILDSFQQLEATLPKAPANKYLKPVITLPGVCHAQFASGTMPPAVKNKDLKPEAGAQAAYAMVANHTSAFLVSALSESVTPTMLRAARVDLDQAYAQTLAIMTPLMAVKRMDDATHSTDHWAIQAQYIQAGLTTQQANITDELLEGKPFLDSRPGISVSGNSAEIRTFGQLTYASNPLDISTTPSGPSELAFKMKTFAAVKDVMPQGTRFNATAANITCKEINEAAFALALQSASPVARGRYQSYGRGMFFAADVVHTTGMGWESSSLGLAETDQGLTVTSHALVTALHVPIAPSLAGMHYCKALAPFRAMEWIYVDSLRSHA